MKIGIIDLCKQIEDPRMNRKKGLRCGSPWIAHQTC